MNKPVAIHAREKASAATLDAKFETENGTIFLNGSQALVRVCLDQADRDEAAGFRTGGFVSGYRGSPLGNVDTAFQSAGRHLVTRNIVFQPGLNEEMAATSCWGSQQLGMFPEAKYDGVFALWYGKGPGVDRASDALKHGNLAGTSQQGGVLVVAGDDHSAKSSTTAHQSEQALIAAMIPILYPSTIQDIVDYGAYAFELSRFSGLWIGFKCATEVVERSGTCSVDSGASAPVLPDVAWPANGRSIGRGFSPAEDERHLIRYRLPAAQAFVRANGLDKVILNSERRTLGIVTAGKAYTDTIAALALLGIDENKAAQLGIRLYKLGMIWPVEPAGLGEFAQGHTELFVVEEKRSVIGAQIAELLFNMDTSVRPSLSGKLASDGYPLLPSDGELSPHVIAIAISLRLAELFSGTDLGLNAMEYDVTGGAIPKLQRSPAFCSGCPHNTSTKVPIGSVALAGIGCHTMALFMPDRPTLPPVQMGGEGANWIGAAPFTATEHVFQNLGDGTYFHSGLLAIRAAVAAKVNITFKILFNDAVAMTGGQAIDGDLSVTAIIHQVRAEGVGEIIVVTDELGKYDSNLRREVGVEVFARENLLAVEDRLRKAKGTSVLIYDQACAAEKRRRRKRGDYPDVAKRLVINESVCEGCGDCGVQSNCVSIQPVETTFGRKRRIDQSSCNKDYSCVQGFCPSFITVKGGEPRRGKRKEFGKRFDAALAALPLPLVRNLATPYAILIAGIGGTGVVTIGAILGMAAKIDGLQSSVLDITGLSQKNGAVLSHLKLFPLAGQEQASRIGKEEADLLIGCDLVVAGGNEVREAIHLARTKIVVNRHMIATAAFQFDPDLDMSADQYLETLGIGSASALALDATDIAERAFGNHLGANMFLVGLAFQLGHLPVTESAILEAISLNNVAADMNRRAFGLGRLAAVGGSAFYDIVGEDVGELVPESVDALIDRLASLLTEYQNSAYADRFRDIIRQIARAEQRVSVGQSRLTEAAAKSLFKLMAYKDEYEVARLHMETGMHEHIAREFEGKIRLEYNFAPPLIARRDPRSGHLKKVAFGQWIELPLRVLSRARRLRGTPFDIFGYTAERKLERQLIADYISSLNQITGVLNGDNVNVAIELAQVPMSIRGFGHVKLRNIELAQARSAELASLLVAAPKLTDNRQEALC